MATGFVVARTEDIPPGTGKVVETEGRFLAVFNVDGAFYVLDNTCLHRGGPLGEGEVKDRTVTCPWHGWQYDVTDGRHLANPDRGVRSYAVEVADGEVRLQQQFGENLSRRRPPPEHRG